MRHDTNGMNQTHLERTPALVSGETKAHSHGPMRVLVAGIGGASLGTEVLKCLRDAVGYEIFGCDISPLAYGHYQSERFTTFVVDRQNYVSAVLELCIRLGVEAVIPGGEEPAVLLGGAAGDFKAANVFVAGNSPEVIQLCSDKSQLFEHFRKLDLPIPRTVLVEDVSRIEDVGYPCVVKPATGTGGSSFVFLANNAAEMKLYASYLLQNGQKTILQEYISVEDGEFTIGVLTLPTGRLVGTVALRRLFHAKLSIANKTVAGLISSGYSQGLIDHFPEYCHQAEKLAAAVGSVGPVNIQGRIRDGILVPFEINPRFSASTYLRACAGFNEVDMYLRYVLHGVEPQPAPVKLGYYLRSLDEVFVTKDNLKQ